MAKPQEDDREHAQRLMGLTGLPRHAVNVWIASSNHDRLDLIVVLEDSWEGDIPVVPDTFEGHRVFLARQGTVVLA